MDEDPDTDLSPETPFARRSILPAKALALTVAATLALASCAIWFLALDGGRAWAWPLALLGGAGWVALQLTIGVAYRRYVRGLSAETRSPVTPKTDPRNAPRYREGRTG